jgi:hypothetical protein
MILVEHGYFGGGRDLNLETARLAYVRFRFWRSQIAKVECSQKKFSPWLIFKGTEPAFTTKAFNTRVLASWLAYELQILAHAEPDDAEVVLAAECTSPSYDSTTSE